jgi:hypothetical protein
MPLNRLLGSRPQVNDLTVAGGLGGKHPVEPGPAVGMDLSVQTAANFEVRARAKLLGDQMLGPSAQARADVFPPDHQVPAVIGLPTHDDVDVWMFRIPMVDPDPVELGSEVPFGLLHKVPSKGFEVGEPVCIIGGDDEAEVVAITIASFRESPMIGIVALGIEHPASAAILAYPIASQVSEMSFKRRQPAFEPRYPRFDDHDT